MSHRWTLALPGLWCLSLAMAVLLLALPAHAQTDWELKSSAQVGVDAWHISAGAQDQPERRFLMTPNARTEWRYRDAAPWYTLHSQLRLGGQGELVLRSRGNQSYGASLDQLYYDHFVSPTLGLRAGILDYRATWCREYDLDNPWVRESDPFCTHRVTNLATASAPALQVYANLDLGAYRVQSVVGAYRPQALGYEPREFSNLILPDSAQVTRNHKLALSLNAVNTTTATEWRVSWVGADQQMSDVLVAPDLSVLPLNYPQQVSTYFAGVSWQLLPDLRSRVTHMRSDLRAHCVYLTPTSAEPCANQFNKSSTVWELAYQLSPADVLSLAVNDYKVLQSGVRQTPLYEARTRTFALAWRRDWRAGWFSAAQLTRSQATIPYNRIPQSLPLLAGTASAWALGLRVGYQF